MSSTPIKVTEPKLKKSLPANEITPLTYTSQTKRIWVTTLDPVKRIFVLYEKLPGGYLKMATANTYEKMEQKRNEFDSVPSDN